MLRAGASIEATGKPLLGPLKTGLTVLLRRRCHPRGTTLSPWRDGVPPYTFGLVGYTSSQPAQRRTFSILVCVVAAGAIATSFACSPRTAAEMSAAEKKAIADTLTRLVVSAYDLSKSDPVKSLMSLYPTEGRVISASGGVMTTSRPELEQGIKAFWTFVGQNMKQPRWEWTSMNVDVLAPDAAVMTSTYRIPHVTPTGTNHVIGGAWTAVFQKREGRWVIIQEHLSDFQSNPSVPANP